MRRPTDAVGFSTRSVAQLRTILVTECRVGPKNHSAGPLLFGWRKYSEEIMLYCFSFVNMATRWEIKKNHPSEAAYTHIIENL